MAFRRKYLIILLISMIALILCIYYSDSKRFGLYEMCLNSGLCTIPGRICDRCSEHYFNDLYHLKPHQDICQPAFLAVVVITHPSNADRRLVLRPFLKQAYHGGQKINYVFTTGSAPGTIDNAALKRENDEHGDILQFSFLDIHHNSALLTTLTFNYVVQRCSSAVNNGVNFVLKMEEDSFVNVGYFVRELLKYSSERKFVAGSCKTAKPERNINDMTFVAKKIYPFEYFPVYCAKYAYAISYKALGSLIKVAPDVPAVHLDEVHITGLCRAVAGVDFVNMPGFFGSRSPSECEIETDVIAMEHEVEENQKKLLEQFTYGKEGHEHVRTRCWIQAKFTVLNFIILTILLITIYFMLTRLFCAERKMSFSLISTS